MSKYLFLIVFIIIYPACKEGSEIIGNKISTAETTHPGFIRDIESAHAKKKFVQNEVVCFNLDLTYKGKKAFEGKIYSTTNSSFIRMEHANGKIFVFKDGKYFSNADSISTNKARFNIQTWQYFFMLPFKLSDPGTKWELLEDGIVNNESFKRCKLTFESGTGDAPDDWYVIHYSPESNLIHHAGYIVTGGTRSVTEAEKSAHSITYSEYINIDSVNIAERWTFSNYDLTNGISDTLGYAKVSNILFLDNVDIFNISNDSSFKEIL